jgi:hypothetical protein
VAAFQLLIRDGIRIQRIEISVAQVLFQQSLIFPFWFLDFNRESSSEARSAWIAEHAFDDCHASRTVFVTPLHGLRSTNHWD